MDNGKLSPHLLLSVTSTLTVLGYILHHMLNKLETQEESCRTWSDDIKTSLIFLSFSFGLSPVLMTLTETISTDTIYAMTTFMLLGNLLFHDYGANAAMVSGSLSLNAAIFASVCLASRLHTTWHAFATVVFAIEVFALWPVLRRNIKIHVHHSQVAMTLFLGLGAAGAVSLVSLVGAVMFILVHVFITFVCPAWLIALQPYKNNIYGPWDEAVIQD